MTRDGKRVYSTAVFHEHNLITSELVIRGFQPRDIAIYKCKFYNEKNVTAKASKVCKSRFVVESLYVVLE